MTSKKPSTGVKSAYEAALERLKQQGVAPPQPESVSAEVRDRVAEIRRAAEAKLAELEILHHDRLKRVQSLEERDQQEKGYLDERRRIQERCEGEIAAARTAGAEGR